MLAHEADLLVHEATFLDDERARARETGHSTARQAAEVAARRRGARCSRSPISPRATSRATSATRRAPSFPDTLVPRDFDTIEVPFPERGEPHLVKEDTPAPT